MKAQFLTPLRLEDLDGAHMTLLEPLKFYSAELKRIVRVNPPFATDFASIPWPLWNLFPKNGLYDYAAVLHDAGYSGQLKDVRSAPLPLGKAQIDSLFREAMAVRGVGTVRRTLMYLAVKWFGRGQFAKETV